MTAVDALFYDGHSARALPVTLTVEAADLVVRGDGITVAAPLAGVRVTSRLARIRRVLQLPDGSQVHCDDNDAIDALFAVEHGGTVVDRLERHPYAIAASLVVTAFVFAWFFAYGLPRIADRVAQQIPQAVEATIGEQALAILDRSLFKPSTVDAARQHSLIKTFGGFVADLPDADRYRLEFRKLPGNQANAFALPGGTIVVSDGLVDAMRDDNAFLAVTAHELGHHVERHVMRSALQGSAIIVLVTMFTGDVSSATGVVLAVPTFLLSSHYSREFERDADAYAFAALRKHDISPEWFAYALSTIEDGVPAAAPSDRVSNYLSSHPPSGDRLAAARTAADGFDALEVLVARSTAKAASEGVTYAVAAIEGCWSGTRKIGDNRNSRWWVALMSDGDMRARFQVFDDAGTVLGTTTNTGRWALQNEIMTVRMLTMDPGTGVVTPIDRLQNYYIDSVSDEAFDYESVYDETYFESTRVDCAQIDE